MKKAITLISVLSFITISAFAGDRKDGASKEANSTASIAVSDFSLNKMDDKIKISWFSVEGTDFETIELEKAENIEEFKTIKTLKGFNSNQALRYISIDTNPVTGENNYRLKMVKKDGSFTYSEIISVGYREVKNTPAAPTNNVEKKDTFGLSKTHFLNNTLILNAA